jgi:hypothetical protein
MPELYARLEAETRSRGIQPETPANSRVAADECPATRTSPITCVPLYLLICSICKLQENEQLHLSCM